MSAGATYQSTKASPTALIVVVAMHGAALAALAMHKMEIVDIPGLPPTTLTNVELDKPPPEIPPEPVVEPVQPSARSPYVPPAPTPMPSEQQIATSSIPQPDEPIVLRPPVALDPPVAIEPPPPPAPKKSQAARAKANLASYVSNDDYPAAALRRGDTGTTRFRLTVGPNGKVTDCAIVGSSGSSTLDSATCRLMRSRARFEPAKNSDGRPTSDSVTSAIRWVLPD